MASPPEPGKILAVILGASTWPGCPALSRQAEDRVRLVSERAGGRQFTAAQVFTRSYERLRRVLDRLLGGNPAAEKQPRLLDLFDGGDVKATSKDAILDQLASFLAPRVNTHTDLLVFFLGHGHLTNGQTYLLPRDAREDDLTGSGLTFQLLDDKFRAVRTESKHWLRQFYFINACHADGFGVGGQVKAFRTPDPHAADGYPSRGAAGLFSSPAAKAEDTELCEAVGLFSSPANKGEPTELRGAGVTAFVAALDWVLTHHPDPAGPRFTLDALARAMEGRIKEWNRLVTAAAEKHPLPLTRVLRSHDASPPSSPHPLTHELPLFPNPAAHVRGCLLLSDSSHADPSRGDLLWRTATLVRDEIGAPAHSLTRLVASDVVADEDAFREAVAVVAESDFAVVDLTGYESAVMLLLGVRAAVRRGVTVSVLFKGPDPPLLPFYLQDISWVNANQPEDDFGKVVVRRVKVGFTSLESEPNRYSDLPVYDAVRRSSEPDQLAGLRDQLLVLCPYDEGEEAWRTFRGQAEWALGKRPPPWAGYPVRRVLDLPSGRLNSWSAFAAIRKAQLCLVDWTDWRPNVFFELGVRLAVNPRAALNVIEGGSVPAVTPEKKGQRERLHGLFAPRDYTRQQGAREMLKEELPRLIEVVDAVGRPQGRPADPQGGVHQLVWDTVRRRQATELNDVTHLARLVQFSAGGLGSMAS